MKKKKILMEKVITLTNFKSLVSPWLSSFLIVESFGGFANFSISLISFSRFVESIFGS